MRPLRGGPTDELFAACLVAPLLVLDVKAELHPEVFASDASSSMGAVVAARVDAEMLTFLWSRIPRRGSYAKLFTDVNANGEYGMLTSSLDRDDAEFLDAAIHEDARGYMYLYASTST